MGVCDRASGDLEKLVIINAPHPGVFGRLLASDAAQQQASQYMLMFRESASRATSLGEQLRGVWSSIVLGSGLKSGVFTEDDQAGVHQGLVEPGALTGGLELLSRQRRWGHRHRPMRRIAAIRRRLRCAGQLTVKVPTLVIWGEKDTALLTAKFRRPRSVRPATYH